MRNAEVRRSNERNPELRSRVADEYRWGFVTDIEQETVPKGLNEDVIRLISAKKNEPEFMLDWRLQAYRHWLTHARAGLGVGAPSADRLPGHPLLRRAEDAHAAEESVRGRPGTAAHLRETRHPPAGTRGAGRRGGGRGVRFGFGRHHLQGQAGKLGIIFCSFSEAVHKHPELVQQYLGSVVPTTDNYFATLNSAVFTDGSFVYVPKGVRCPMELSTYFRINAKNTGQFERTLIIADEGAYVSYLEGCTAPMRDENQLHAAVVELVALKDAPHQVFHRAELVSRRPRRAWRNLQLRHQARRLPWRQRAHFLDPGRDRIGHHLEISELHPARRQQRRRVLFGRADQPSPAGRHRHQDDPHRQEHPQHHRLQGHFRRLRQQCLSRSGEGAARR